MNSHHITSIEDERGAEARELTSAAGRARFLKMQLEGEESIHRALEARLPVEHIFYSASLRQCSFLEALWAWGIPCYAASDGIMKRSATPHISFLFSRKRAVDSPI